MQEENILPLKLVTVKKRGGWGGGHGIHFQLSSARWSFVYNIKAEIFTIIQGPLITIHGWSKK